MSSMPIGTTCPSPRGLYCLSIIHFFNNKWAIIFQPTMSAFNGVLQRFCSGVRGVDSRIIYHADVDGPRSIVVRMSRFTLIGCVIGCRRDM